jgi:hypothetical protein
VPVGPALRTKQRSSITTAEFSQWLITNQGIAPAPVTTPEAFAAIQRRDVASWAEVVRRSGATVD